MIATIQRVEPVDNAERLIGLFEKNTEDPVHAHAVIAEGAADLWLAESNDQLVGALLGGVVRSTYGGLRGGVESFLVDSTYRQRGIGRRLMEVAEEHYRIRGLYGMQLTVGADNHPARSLYDSMAYHIVRQYTRIRQNCQGNEVVEQRVRMWKGFESAGSA